MYEKKIRINCIYLATKMTDPIKTDITGQAYIKIITVIRSSISKIYKNATVQHMVKPNDKELSESNLTPWSVNHACLKVRCPGLFSTPSKVLIAPSTPFFPRFIKVYIAIRGISK